MIKAIFNWTNGKKTLIGGAVAFVAGGAFTIGLIDQKTFDTIIQWDLIVLGVGLSHKLMKSR